MGQERIVKIEGLLKKYGKLVAVNHLNLEIKEGEIFGLLGPNGSGKSTIISCLLALLRYDKGNIEIFGKQMKNNAKDIKENIGVVLQDVAVFDELTVYENIEYFCSLYMQNKGEVKRLTEEAIRFVTLEEFRDYYPKKLSGGLLRRLNIACGVAHRPKLVILDEPTVAVDPQSRNKILEGIKTLNSRGTTIIYTTHYMEEVEQLCDRIAIIDKGEVIALGTKEELKDKVAVGETIVVETSSMKRAEVEELVQSGDYLVVEYQEGILKVKAKKDGAHLKQLLVYLEKQGITTKKIYSELPTLNDVFLEITGKALRD